MLSLKKIQSLVDCSDITDLGKIDERYIFKDGTRVLQKRNYIKGTAKIDDNRITWFGVRETEISSKDIGIIVEDVYVNGKKVTEL